MLNLVRHSKDIAWTPKGIRELRKRLSATQEEFARILDVVTSTVHRWEKGEVRPDRKTGEKLTRLRKILEIMDKYFEEEGRVEFFTTPDPRLDGDRPLDLLLVPSGVKRMRTFVASIRAGDFA